MLAEFFRFDLRQQLRSPLLWVAGLLFALFAFGATSSDFIQLGGAIGNVNRNAPGVIVNMFINFSLLGLFVVTFFIAQPVLRDFELGTDELFFSSPMKPRAYLAGRILAGMVAALAIFVLTSGGIGKLAVYAGLGIPEVWFYEAGAFAIYALGKEGYEAVEASRLVPGIDFAKLAEFVERDDQHEAVKSYVAHLRGR